MNHYLSDAQRRCPPDPHGQSVYDVSDLQFTMDMSRAFSTISNTLHPRFR